MRSVAASWILIRIPLLAAFSITASYVLAYYFP